MSGLTSPCNPDPQDPERCRDCAARAQGVCALCDASELSSLDAVKTLRSFAPGQEILGAGEPILYVGSIVDGVVKLTKTLLDGRRQMVGLLFPSDFIGRAKHAVSEYDAVAVSDVTVCAFPRQRFEGLMAQTPHLEQRMLEMTLDELDAARDWLLLLGRKSAREKVASFLCVVARRIGVGEGEERRFEIPISRDDMADYLGLTIETVSRQVSKLRREGVIEIERHRDVRVASMSALLEAAGDDVDGGVIP